MKKGGGYMSDDRYNYENNDNDKINGNNYEYENDNENDYAYEEDTRRQWHDDDLSRSKENLSPYDEMKESYSRRPINYGYSNQEQRREEPRREAPRREENKLNESSIRNIVREEISRNYKPKRSWVSALALILVGAILAGVIGLAVDRLRGDDLAYNGASTQNTQAPIEITPQEEMNVENAVSIKASPSVVGILTTMGTRTPGNLFFGVPGQEVFSEAIGSGVIVSENGYILTNSHVVNNGDYEDITVIFNDGTDIKADLLWNDQTLDLAILKVDKNNLQAIEIGNSDEVHVGDKAIAIGNPLALNLQSTLTSGYISGLDRSIRMEDGSVMDGLIQTDAAINGGNSGGALLNSQGELIGINTAKANMADGIGFAIPVNVAMPIVERVTETGSFETVVIGIQGIGLETYLSYYPDEEAPVDEGVLVVETMDGTAADQAGLKSGDIIVKLDDYETGSMSLLKQALINYEYGDEVKISFYSDGELKEETVRFTKISSQST